MEMKLKTVIDILKQELNPNRPVVEGAKPQYHEESYGAGVRRCIDLLTKISAVGEARTFFEFGEGDDNLVLLIPYNYQENFLSYLEIAFNKEQSPESVGDYLSIQGALSNEYPREKSVKH